MSYKRFCRDLLNDKHDEDVWFGCKHGYSDSQIQEYKSQFYAPEKKKLDLCKTKEDYLAWCKSIDERCHEQFQKDFIAEFGE